MERPHNSSWQVVTFSRPVLWTRSDDEVWMFNPRRRYILNANQLKNLSDYVDTISDLRGMPEFRPLRQGEDVVLSGSRILVERFRERGIGDLLFTTGPLSYLHHLTGGDISIDYYTVSSRGQVLTNNPVLEFKTSLAGPLHYDDLRYYSYHWLIDVVTEYNEEGDQLNVYDALYTGMGIDPKTVPVQFKRPIAVLGDQDRANLDQFLYYTYAETKIDLRTTPYYVVAPLSYGSLRTMEYRTWLRVIDQLSQRRPVVVVGHLAERLPATSITVGEFNEALSRMGGNVINALGNTPERVLMGLLNSAKCAVTLDSGPLYIAQAFRTPCVSVWGTHDPGVRIGYDKDYMDLAVWNQAACRFSPCFAYSGFPADKCPNGAEQHVCEPLATVPVEDIIAKVDLVESADYALEPVAAAKG